MYNVMKRIWEINLKWPSESRVRVLNTLANILRLKVRIVLRRYVYILDYLHRDHYDKILSSIVCFKISLSQYVQSKKSKTSTVFIDKQLTKECSEKNNRVGSPLPSINKKKGDAPSFEQHHNSQHPNNCKALMSWISIAAGNLTTRSLLGAF